MLHFDEYLKNKFETNSQKDVFASSIKYIGGYIPEFNRDLKYSNIVDHWLESAIQKWDIEIQYMDIGYSKLLAKLVPTEGGFRVTLNKNSFGFQRRFIFAHELAHIVFFDKKDNWYERSTFHSWKEEKFCDMLARKILIPSSILEELDFNLEDFNQKKLDSLKAIWRQLKVSPFQLVKRIHEEMNTSNMICVHWRYDYEAKALRVVDSSGPKDIFIPKRKRAYDTSSKRYKETNLTPGLALGSDRIIEQVDCVLLGSIYKENLKSQTFRIKTRRNSTEYNQNVFQIIHLGESHSLYNDIML